MRPTILICIAAVSVLAIAARGDDAEQIQGGWIVVSAETAGKSVESTKGEKFTFTGDKVTIETNGMKLPPLSFTLDPTTSQKQINILDKPPWRGIYEFDGDQLKLCYANTRPADFDSTAGLLLVLRRQKP